MARGNVAKSEVAKRLAQAFGANYIGEYDKKHYVWANDGGEKVQIAISMTCPKTFIEAEKPVAKTETKIESGGGDWDFSDDNKVEYKKTERAEITEEEKQNIANLMASLGL